VGEEFGTKTVEQFNMGGIGSAYSSPFHLNFSNPASLSELSLTTYAFGILNNRLTVKSVETSQSSNSTSLSYFAIGIPVSDRIGLIAGMQPTSAVGYSLINTIEDGNGELIDLTQFTGSGAVNRLYGGIGIRLFKGISVGGEIDFLFGNVENSVINLRQNVVLTTKNVEDANIRGASVKLGLQYKKDLKNNYQVKAGATFKLENSLRATGQEHLYSVILATNGAEFPRDTIFSGALRGKLNRPLETSVGIGLGKIDKWYAEVDYSFRDAFDATGYLNDASQSFAYGDYSRVSLGGFYIPKINALNNYWQRVTYRAGLRYERTGLLVNGVPGGSTFTGINDFGMSFGIGLPIGKQFPSSLNFAVEYGQRGTTDNSLLQENYLNLRLSLSLNDKWFIKRRID
jgi:hypothetical protein